MVGAEPIALLEDLEGPPAGGVVMLSTFLTGTLSAGRGWPEGPP